MILALMLQAERRDGVALLVNYPGVTLPPEARVVDKVKEYIAFELQIFGEVDPVDQHHILMGPGYLPDIEAHYLSKFFTL